MPRLSYLASVLAERKSTAPSRTRTIAARISGRRPLHLERRDDDERSLLALATEEERIAERQVLALRELLQRLIAVGRERQAEVEHLTGVFQHLGSDAALLAVPLNCSA
jgi:hypothetical protein